MEYIAMFLGILSLLGFAAFIIWMFVAYIKLDVIDPFIGLRKTITSSQRAILKNKFPYYINLNEKLKKEFERRLAYFIANKEFVPKGMTKVTDEMKVLIGASAVQITFGYRPIKFIHFPKILLFPGRFSTKQNSSLKKGEVNSRGLIVLSWKDFIHDYKIQHDGINLGLHEMAHALKVEDGTPGEEYAFINEYHLDNFYEVSKDEFNKIRRGKHSFIRSYAGTNGEEFFAVAVEQFFEQPIEFKNELPEIYYALVEVLNQDPSVNYKSDPVSQE